MKNIKRNSIIILIIISLFCASGCGARKKSEARLVKDFNKHIRFDFDLLQDVGKTDMNSYNVKITTAHSTDYYDPKYESEYQKGQTKGQYVAYSVTPYPAYTSGGHFVTMIYCSDPNINFFGVNLLFSLDNIQSAFEDAGYKTELTYKNGTRCLRATISKGIMFGVYETVDGFKYFAAGATVLEDKHTVDFFK